MRRTISPHQQRPKRRHEDLRDPHGARPTQERTKDREKIGGEPVPRLPGGGKDRADLSNPVRDCWGEETKARSLGVKVSKKKAWV
jgi:hypothetical protein